MADRRRSAVAEVTTTSVSDPVPSAPAPGRQLLSAGAVPVRVTAGSVLLAAWLTLIYKTILISRFPGLGAGLWPTATVFPAVFAFSVVLHEVGHAWAGRSCGLRVRWIVVDGLGGATEFDRDAATPRDSALVAAAGPAVSVTLGLLFDIAAHLTTPGTVVALVLSQAAIGNLIVAAFNLLPGLPLDGGYLLRAVVWRLTGSPRSGTIAAAVGGNLVACAIVIVPIVLLLDRGARPGILGVAILLFIAVPIARGAWATVREEDARAAANKASAGELARPAPTIHPAEPVRQALRLITACGADGLAVVDRHQTVLGLISECELVGVPPADRDLITVGQLVRPIRATQLVPTPWAGEHLRLRVEASGEVMFLVCEDSGRDRRLLMADDVIRRVAPAADSAPGRDQMDPTRPARAGQDSR